MEEHRRPWSVRGEHTGFGVSMLLRVKRASQTHILRWFCFFFFLFFFLS